MQWMSLCLHLLTETQGLVVTEAMASGIPVVAVNGPGIGEVVTDFRNGRLLDREDTMLFAGRFTG